MSSIVNLNPKIRVLCGAGRLKEAVDILLTTHNTAVESSTYLHLLNSCVSKKALAEGYAMHGYSEDASKLFELMRRSGVKLDHQAINTVLKCKSRGRRNRKQGEECLEEIGSS
ncbi:hypothetical protein SUGI_0827930 [Cryptomeria japonica]|nr:hypothetical protein SUGI_0827930 [Cryptomeria japonica]